MPASLLVPLLLVGVVLGLARPTFGAPVITPALFDFVTFDGIDYVRWEDEPGRPLAPPDLGAEFATVGCSFGEDSRGCPYGMDAGAAFMPAGTRMYAVRGYATEFRLAAVWKDRIFLYQAWRNPRARAGGDLFDLAGKVRTIDVETDGADPGGRRHATVTAPGDVEALIDLIVRAQTRRPLPHAPGETRYWLTFWFADGTTLGRPYYPESRELMGGVVVGGDFTRLLEGHLATIAPRASP